MIDPVAAKLKANRLLTEPDVLGLSRGKWIFALYPAFAWWWLVPSTFGMTFGPRVTGTVLLAAFFYAACRHETAKERLRDLSQPARDLRS